ncbi:MAG: hypothetical protein K1Y36_06880 [Blastocatellia bacterium]|nr:hypothetical protein [Blastocatellia bacterium]
MFKKIIEATLGLAFLALVVIALVSLMSWLFHWNLPQLPPGSMLTIGAGFLCLTGLLFILKVPWDLFFETKSILFEMKRSEEAGIPVRPERKKYVSVMKNLTLLLAIGAHIVSSALIAGITYYSNGYIGYYFAGFYLLSTFFRPAAEAHRFLLAKLSEIRGEVHYPREDIIKLRHEMTSALDDIKQMRQQLEHIENRFLDNERVDRKLESETNDLRAAMQRAEQSFNNRMGILTDEVERSLTKAMDHAELVNGLRAFARLVKQA